MPVYNKDYKVLTYQLYNFDICPLTYGIINQDEKKIFRT